MTTAASRRAKLAESVMPTDKAARAALDKSKAAEAALDKSVDYSDEVTAEQRLQVDRAFSHLGMDKWKTKRGPAW